MGIATSTGSLGVSFSSASSWVEERPHSALAYLSRWLVLYTFFTNIHLLWNGEPSLIAKRACTHKPLPLLIDCCIVLYYYVGSFDGINFCEWLVSKFFEISTGIICHDLIFL